MNAPVLVTGGTGNIGRRVVPLLREAGRDVRILSRHPREDEPGIQHVQGDTVAGSGVAAALEGVDVVLHLAGGAKGDDVAARNLAAAARDAGVRHLVLISVIGADRMPIGYFRAKAEAERVIAGSGVPWTVLRAAQLHDFVLPIARGMARMPLLPVPGGLRFEPVRRRRGRGPARGARARRARRPGRRPGRAGSARHPAARGDAHGRDGWSAAPRHCRFACPARSGGRTERARTWRATAPTAARAPGGSTSCSVRRWPWHTADAVRASRARTGEPHGRPRSCRERRGAGGDRVPHDLDRRGRRDVRGAGDADRARRASARRVGPIAVRGDR